VFKCANRGAGGRGGRRFDAETDFDVVGFDRDHNHDVNTAGDFPAEDN
jgi:hypothetical protein